MNTQENPFEDKDNSLIEELERIMQKSYAVYDNRELELAKIKTICRYVTLVVILLLISIAYSEQQATQRESIKYHLDYTPTSSYLPNIRSFNLTVYTNEISTTNY